MSDIIINGQTYEGVDTIQVENTEGETITFVEPTPEGWQPNPTWWDIKTILENDTRDYPNKAIYLYIDTTEQESSLNLNGEAYATSDGAFYETTTLTHTWDRSKDKECYIDGVKAYKTRYVIAYSNSTLNIANKQRYLLYYYSSTSKAGWRAFYECDSLESVNISSCGSTLNEAFTYCDCLKAIPAMDTSNVTMMQSTFTSCFSLKTIPTIDTSKVTDMYSMFNGCHSLETIPAIDTSNVTTMQSMFYNCYCLKAIPAMDTSNVTNMQGLFYNCYCLETIAGLDMEKVSSVSDMFWSCKSLKSVNLKNIKKSGIYIGSGTSFGHLLSIDSLVNTIKELWDYSTGETTYTLTMGTANTAKLTNVYVKLITPTAEQIEADPNIESKMPCEVCASTDEGAMLITDYATLKKWTIA